MNSFNILLIVFLYVVIVYQFIEGFYQTHGKTLSHDVEEHVHKTEKPCSVCPRHGACVPRVQCPAHIRPNSLNPSCHLENGVGVCCFTGRSHAAESDLKLRNAAPIEADDIKTSHMQAKQKLTIWLEVVQKLLDQAKHTVLNSSSPSFAHHMSLTIRDKAVQKLARGGLLNLFAAQELKARQAISDDELTLGLTEHTDGPFCPPTPDCPVPPSRYRSVGGECNNPTIPSWGAANTGYEKLLPPDYSDGIWGMRTSSTGDPLPSARAVSSVLLLDGSHPSRAHNMIFMQFGQFVVHDISAGVVFSMGNGSAISCCVNDGEDFLPPELQHGACAPITAELDDPFYGEFRHTCLNFVRTQLAPASDCSVGYAKQMNGATHYLDLSQLYGKSPEKFSALQAPGGLLKTFNDFGRELPPLSEKDGCLIQNEGAACFDSGDNHGNQIISLTVFHTIWTREHNRVARGLTRLNPMWNEETVFMETRRILQAIFQHIVYNEWLPMLLGPHFIQFFGLMPSSSYATSYDPNFNPAVSAEFSTSAMRFGHSTVDGILLVQSSQTGGMHEAISLPEVMFQPSRLRLRHFLDRLLMGLTTQPMQTVDPFVTEGLTRYMFHGVNPYGVDLASINIQRGRDYGVRSYNHYRRLIGLAPYVDFSQFTPNTAHRLSSVYASPEDIDLWVGGLLEETVDGGIVGPTFAHIIGDQFSRLKKGDRYFYEYGPDVNPGAFTAGQLSEIKKVTLSRIICDNSDGIELVMQPPEAFLRSDLPGNGPVRCDSPLIPAMDLSRFKDI
ncbi:hypothetical protein K1T71_006457 [Dendrolimus kikuchii]|uniref:Uncharacterized protein n=1 Tax=Dendrolimus kikuchii TaxID=765133 RepID=A0ACC1D0U8_9NEOP|nr:hypothetical protein K1T71_006457 [Dendrolimus kikuchii]